MSLNAVASTNTYLLAYLLIRQIQRQSQLTDVDSLKELPILRIDSSATWCNKKHLKNVWSIRHCKPFYIAIHQVSLLSHAATVARRLRIDVRDNDNDDNNDNA